MRESFTALAAGSCDPPAGDIAERLSLLLCKVPEDAASWKQLLSHAWPYVAAAAVLIVAARFGWYLLARRAWGTRAQSAVWLEITPPVSATPASTTELWRLLASYVKPSGWLPWRPLRRMVFEVFAEPDRMRVGVWVTPDLGVHNVSSRIQQAWPGARITQTTPPTLPHGLVLHGLRLQPSEPDSLDYTITAATGGGLDPMRSVYDSLASGGRQGGALLQIIVQGATASRLKAFQKMITDPAGARASHTGRGFDVALRGTSKLLLGAVSLFTPSRPADSVPGTSRTMSPQEQERVDRAKAKKRRTPTFLVGIRVFGLGEDREAARNSATHVAGGFDLIAPTLSRRLVRQAREVADTRWIRSPQLVLSSVTEVAALTSLPAEPPAYGMFGAASRRRAGTADVWHPGNSTPSTHDSDTDPDDGEPFVFDPWAMA